MDKTISTNFIIILFLLFTFLIFNTTSPSIAIFIPKTNELIFKDKFSGKWLMQTIVTDSECPYIFTGSTTESKLEIKPLFINKTNNNLFKVRWQGGKWTSSNSVIKLLNEKEGITERVTKLETNDNNNWKAILIDHLYLDEENNMHSESIVTQYKNGIEVGEYKTFSILTKLE